MGTKPSTYGLMRVLVAGLLFAASASRAQSNASFNSLFVYGNGYAFQVREPEGWHGDTKKIAAAHSADAYFVPFGEVHDGGISIRVKVSHKVDENTIEDLNHDLEYYRNSFPNAQFKNLDVVHGQYKAYAKSILVPHQLYVSEAFVNPGPYARSMFFVTMTKKREPETDAEIRAFEDVVRSLVWLYVPKR